MATPPSSNRWFLLIFNILIPILGMVFLGWATIEIIYLYWSETIIIGLYNLPKMLLARGKRVVFFGKDFTEQIKQKQPEQSQYIDHFPFSIKVGLTLFFIVHYGMFCGIQGAFIFRDLPDSDNFFGALPFGALVQVLSEKGLWLSVVLFALTNGFDFVVHFIANKEYEQQHMISLMIAPYKRVFVQQFVVIFGGAFLLMMNAPIGAAILLVIFRAAADWFVDSPRFKEQIERNL